jgi:hypothetical protein
MKPGRTSDQSLVTGTWHKDTRAAALIVLPVLIQFQTRDIHAQTVYEFSRAPLVCAAFDIVSDRFYILGI